MYRAYPSPSQQSADGGPGSGPNTKKANGMGSVSTSARASASAIGSPPKAFGGGPPIKPIGGAGAGRAGAALPGGIKAMPKIKFGNPTLGIPPPTKKQRAIPSTVARMGTQIKRDELTKLADEGIARRRAQLRNLKARGQGTPSILERAKAVTASSNQVASTTQQQQQQLQQPSYPTRTRPIAANRSPSRTSRSVPNVNVNANDYVGSNGSGSSSGASPRITNLGMRLASNAPNPANGSPSSSSSPPRKQYEAPPRKKITTPFQPQSNVSSSTTTTNAKPVASPPLGPITTNGNGGSSSTSATPTPAEVANKSEPSITDGVPAVPPLVDEKKTLDPAKENGNGEKEANVKIVDTTGPPPTTKQEAPVSTSSGDKQITAPPPVVPLLEPKTTKTKRETLSTLWNAAASPIRPTNPNGSGSGNGSSNSNGKDENGDSTEATVALKNVTNMDHENENLNQSTATNGSSFSSSQAAQNSQTATLRMVKELRKAKEDKEEAMKRLARLESEVMELRLKRESANNTSRGRQSAENDGSPRRRRMKSPEPTTRGRPDMDPLADREVATRAVDAVEDVFASDLATYVVRKPYGGSNDMEYVFADDEDGDGGRVSWEKSIESYGKTATVKDNKTIEVLAKLKADGSVLLIWGSSSCRYGSPTHGDQGILGYEFETFKDVDYMDGSLKKIIFIDSEGNDGEYWLDPVYEEALKIRESYCSNVFSAALALKAATSPPQPRGMPGAPFGGSPNNGFGQQQFHDVSPPGPSNASSGGPKPPMTDACVGTEDMQKSKVSGAGPGMGRKSEKQPPVQKQAKQKKKKQLEMKEEPVDVGSADVLPHFILFFFSSIFSVIWFILMLPVRVTRMFLTSALIFGIGHLLWMHFADIQDAMNMGAAIDTQYNI